MYLIHSATGNRLKALVEPLAINDFKVIKTTKRFKGFDWNKEKHNEVYKLRLETNETILGLMSITDMGPEPWIRINLLQSSIENKGINKEHENIAGVLIAFACRLSFKKGYEGFVALHPKTALVNHYQKQYGFERIGPYLCSTTQNSESLIKKYLL